ncbi:uncharacterized protein B4U80_07789 [Leptotrombidium deliense]|uniref:Chitin-binding type-4 domain-containing protein n=1 Tax=Leptotrombidium deliense TaxID=299467 RepID=A0A443S4C5_9ACAR|nr:uncharacterized protein B4U80_07789 [Leptotrombidium deliense]
MKLLLLNLCVYLFIEDVFTHGRLIDPPSRSTAWRYGFKTPVNYNDHELFCGGFQIQWNMNGGKCGICGDAFNGERQNELPNGIYARNLVISRHYKRGSRITTKVHLTKNHNGSFQFKLCPATTMNFEVTQECLDANILEVLNSKEKLKYILPSRESKIFEVKLKLPEGIACNRCVLQWTYTTENNWGACGDGTARVGCGDQETFRACADIKIDETGPSRSIYTDLDSKGKEIAIQKVTSSTNAPKQSFETMTESAEVNNVIGTCRATEEYKSIPSINEWCTKSCGRGFCPSTHCQCSPV